MRWPPGGSNFDFQFQISTRVVCNLLCCSQRIKFSFLYPLTVGQLTVDAIGERAPAACVYREDGYVSSSAFLW